MIGDKSKLLFSALAHRNDKRSEIEAVNRAEAYFAKLERK